MSTPTIETPLTAEARRGRLLTVAAELTTELGHRPSHADLARRFNVTARTIGRDLRQMAAAGKSVPLTRGDADMNAAATRRAGMPAVIRQWAAQHGGRAPTQVDLADHYGVSRRSIQVDLEVLASEGLVTVERKGRHTVWVAATD
jgi:predicted DNA-binding transcriptional regulator YafY